MTISLVCLEQHKIEQLKTKLSIQTEREQSMNSQKPEFDHDFGYAQFIIIKPPKRPISNVLIYLVNHRQKNHNLF